VLYNSSNNIITNNTVLDHNGIGIYLDNSQNNSFFENNILGNHEGVYCNPTSENNLFYKNAFAYSFYQNADDSGINNHWNMTDIGNFWSDYQCTPWYPIYGSAGSFDYHPAPYPPDVNICSPSISCCTYSIVTWSAITSDETLFVDVRNCRNGEFDIIVSERVASLHIEITSSEHWSLSIRFPDTSSQYWSSSGSYNKTFSNPPSGTWHILVYDNSKFTISVNFDYYSSTPSTSSTNPNEIPDILITVLLVSGSIMLVIIILILAMRLRKRNGTLPLLTNV